MRLTLSIPFHNSLGKAGICVGIAFGVSFFCIGTEIFKSVDNNEDKEDK